MTADIRCSFGFVNQVKATRRCYISTADNRQKENCKVCRLARMCDTIRYNIMAKHLRGGLLRLEKKMFIHKNFQNTMLADLYCQSTGHNLWETFSEKS